MWALLILPYLFICCLPLYFVFIEMYWWQKLAVNLLFFKSKVNVAGLRELTRACVGVNDCSYFSFKSEVTNHNILCPPQTELCVTGPAERELKHSCLITLPIEFSFWTTSVPVFQHWKPSCNHQSSWEILCPSRSGFHSPCCSDKDGSGGQQCPAPGAGVTVGDEAAQSWGQTHRCSFKLHLSQEGKSLFWWIKSLKLIPTQNDFPALAVKEGGVLRESLGYRRQWQRRVADLSHLRQSSAMMENCPKHLQSQVRAWLNQKHHQGTQSSDILSNQKTSSQPLVQPVHNDQEEAIQCYPFYQTRISCQQFLQFTVQPKDNCFPSELTLRGETLRRQIYLHSTITNSIRRVSAQEM